MNTTSSINGMFFGFKEGEKLTFSDMNELCAKIYLIKSVNKKEYDHRYYLLYKEQKKETNRKYMLKHGEHIRNKEKRRQRWNRSVCGVIGRGGYFCLP